MPSPLRRVVDDLLRSVRLFRSFRSEGSDPDGFYGLIARDAVTLVSAFRDLDGLTVADIGGGPGYYSRAFQAAGARTVLIDADHGEITGKSHRPPPAVVGTAFQLPLADDSVDVCFSSNMLEHVSDPDHVRAELARVVRPGGLLVLSYTNWLSPWGGHETSPWHFLGGHRAARRYERRTGTPPKNRFGTSLYAISVADGLRWARSRTDLTLLDERPRYLPSWSRVLLRVPLLREMVTWNLWQVLEKDPR